MITREIKVWIGAAQGIIPPVKVSQYDTEWQFVFTVYKDDVVWDMAGVSTVSLNGVKEDGTAFVYPGSISSSHVVVDCGEQMTSAAGRVECELRFFTNYGKLVSTANFRLLVEQAPMTGYRASGSEFDEMNQLVNAALEGIPAWVAEHLTDEAAAQAALEAEASATAAAASATAAANEVPAVKAEMSLFGVDDLFWEQFKNKTTTAKGLTYTENANSRSISISGSSTATSGAPSFRRFYYDQSNLPSWAEAGETYRGRINSEKVWLEIYSYPGSDLLLRTKGSDVFTIPSSAEGLMIRIAVYVTGNVDPVVYPCISKAMTLPELEEAIPTQVSAATVSVKSEMALFGVEDLLWQGSFSWRNTGGIDTRIVDKANRTVTLDGTTTAAMMFDFYANDSALPSWAEAGGTYYARIKDGGPVRLRVYEYIDGVAPGHELLDLRGDAEGSFTLASNAVGMIVRLYLASGNDVDVVLSASVSVAPSLMELSKTKARPTASILFFGDSIVRGSTGISGGLSPYRIPDIVASELGVRCENFGIGDIGWTKNPGGNKTTALGYLQRIGNLDYYSPTDTNAGYKFLGSGDWPDFNTIVISLGPNDINDPLGDMQEDIITPGLDAMSYEDIMDLANPNRHMSIAMYQCYRYIRNISSTINIIFSGPIVSKGSSGVPPLWSWKLRGNGGWAREDLNNFYKAFCERYGIGYIDNQDAPIDRVDITNSLADNVHPKATTYPALGLHYAAKVGALIL